MQENSDLLTKSRMLFTQGNLEEAYSTYKIIMLHTEDNLIKKEFLACAFGYGDYLVVKNDLKKAVEVLKDALNAYPDDYNILSKLGRCYLRRNAFLKSEECLAKAYSLNQNSLSGLLNFEGFKENVVEQWHFKMLNDQQRNLAYKTALDAKIKENDIILDIGAGCGLLSLYAAKNANTNRVIAIEQNEIQNKIGRNIMNINYPRKKIDQICKNSTKLKALEPKADVLVTEIFDTAFFGEHALSTIIHALIKLVKREKYTVIPCKVTLYFTGVTSAILKQKNVLEKSTALFNIQNCEYTITQKSEEPYDAFYVKTDVPDVNFLTTTESFDVNLTNLQELKEIFVKKLFNLKFTVINEGLLLAFMVYFDLYLTEDIKITTNPNSEECLTAWEQAFIFLDLPFVVKINDSINAQCSCVFNKLKLHINSENNATQDNTQLAQFNISYLNDKLINNALKCVRNDLNKFLTNEKAILDLNSSPILGILLCNIAKNCFVKKLDDEKFVLNLTESNNVDFSKIICVDFNDVTELNDLGTFVDLILFEPITKIGCINTSAVKNYNFYKQLLKPNGIIIPQSVKLCFCVIESDFYKRAGYVQESNLCGINGASFVNEYFVNEFYDVNGKAGHIKKLSETITAHNILINDDTNINIDYNCDIIDNGDAVGVLVWYDINLFNDISIQTIDTDYYKCALYYFNGNKSVKKGDSIKVNVRQECELLKLFV